MTQDIHLHFSCLYTSSQNGKNEEKIRTTNYSHYSLSCFCSRLFFISCSLDVHLSHANGVSVIMKARFVGDSASRQDSVDCGNTFSLMVKLATIRMVLNLVISKFWCIHQLDVKNAFLQENHS